MQIVAPTLGVPDYVLLGVIVVWSLPAFGKGVLSFLRDLERYREEHRNRRG